MTSFSSGPLRFCLQKHSSSFQKNFVSPKMAAILNFRIFCKYCKTQNAYISKTVLNRAISMKFLTHRVFLQSSHVNFQNIFVSPNMAAILNFQILAKFAKHNNPYILKTMLDRGISTKCLTHRVSLQITHPNYQRNFILPKMATILNFLVFLLFIFFCLWTFMNCGLA